MNTFANKEILNIPYLNTIDILNGKQEIKNQRLSDVIDALKGKNVLLYSLEGLSYGADTTLLPYMWNVIELLKRELDSNAIIIHPGIYWQQANGVPKNIAQQASNVRVALLKTYLNFIDSDIIIKSSDNIHKITDDFEFLKYAYNTQRIPKKKKNKKSEIPDILTTFKGAHNFITGSFEQSFKRDLEGPNSYIAEVDNPTYTPHISTEEQEINRIYEEFKNTFNSPLGEFKRAVKNIIKNSEFGADYTLYELAVNKTIIDYARTKGLTPVKISLKNQSADYILNRKGLNLDAYVIRLKLPVQPVGVGVIPYSVPSNGLTAKDDYFLTEDSLEELTRKLNGSKNKDLLDIKDNDLLDTIRLYMYLINEKTSLNKNKLITIIDKLNRAFTDATKDVGGYPVKCFVAPIHLGNYLKNDPDALCLQP